MFHTYILTKGGSMVDFDRASFLMDDELLQRAPDARRTAREPPSPSDELPGGAGVEIPLLLGSHAVDPSWSDTLSARRNAWTFDPVIRTKAGSVMDYDRAVLLLDKTLVQETLRAKRTEQDACPGWDVRYGAQWIWDDYCRRHLEKYGEQFAPDVIPGWDKFPTPGRD